MKQQIYDQMEASTENIRSDEFSSRLNRLMEEGALTQDALAKKIGVGQSRVSEWAAGKAMPHPRSIRDLAEFFKVNREWLATGGGSRTNIRVDDADTPDLSTFKVAAIFGDPPKGRMIRVVSWAQAGAVTDYEEVPIDWEVEAASDCPDRDAIGVQLRGDSMLPIYQEGDVVIIMPKREPRTGCLVVAKLRDEGVCFKIYSEPRRGVIKLSSYNEAFPPIERRRDDFEWICPVYEARRNLWFL